MSKLMTAVSLILAGLLLNTSLCSSQECTKKPKLVYHEKGDVMVTALLDLTQGPQCNQTNAASSHSMNGILQTFQTLNSIQYIKGFKIGIRIYDTCSQETMALQAVLETALEANLTQSLSCRAGAHLGFLFPIRSYPAAAQLLNVLNLPLTDISYWQTTSPLDAVADLLTRFKWTSVSVISQSKPTLLSFSKIASERNICIVSQSVLSPINRTKEMTIRAVRRSKRSGSKIYVLIGSSEFLLNILPHFEVSNTSSPPMKYVLLAADNWNSNFSQVVGQYVKEALIIRPQRVLTDDNVSARVLYSLVKQFKHHLLNTCNGNMSPCDFEPHHMVKKMVLAEEDLRILKLSKDISIYNELFPVSHVSKGKQDNGSKINVIDIGNIHEDKFIPFENNQIIEREEVDDCGTDCLCTNVENTSGNFVFQLRNELHIIIIGSVSVLALLFTISGFALVLHIQCFSTQEDKSGNFMFLVLFTLLILLSVSFLYVLVPSSVLCLSRVIALSGAYTLFLSALFSVAATSLIGDHSGSACFRTLLQLLIFILAVGVQIPILSYETLFRDETLLINKFLTDFGPKIECTLDDMLSLKLFIYPMILQGMLAVASIAVISSHWKVSAIKIHLSISTVFCLLINISWTVCYFLLEKQWQDIVILVGIQSNAFTILLGVLLPKVISGLRTLRHSFLTEPWQANLLNHNGNSVDNDGQTSHSSVPAPPVRPQQHIYTVSQYNNHRSSSESGYDENTAM